MMIFHLSADINLKQFDWTHLYLEQLVDKISWSMFWSVWQLKEKFRWNICDCFCENNSLYINLWIRKNNLEILFKVFQSCLLPKIGNESAEKVDFFCWKINVYLSHRQIIGNSFLVIILKK